MWSCASLSSCVGRDARLDVQREHVQHLRSQPAGDAHARDVFGRLEGDRHRAGIITPPAKMCPLSPQARTVTKHLVHLEGGNALSAFRAQALLPRLREQRGPHRRRACAPRLLGVQRCAARPARGSDKLTALLTIGDPYTGPVEGASWW